MYLGDGRLVQRQDNSEHPKIKYYLVQKLTDDAPTAQKQLIDFKTVQKKEQEKSDTPLTQYSKNAFVNIVRVNDTVNVSLRVHGNERRPLQNSSYNLPFSNIFRTFIV